MSGILGGGGKTAGTTVTRYTSLQVQTSAAGVAIPIGWGTNRTGTNLIWYGNFQSTSQSQGGKGGGGGATSYTYTCAVAMALGEGPITGIGKVWASKDATTLADLNLTLMTGTAGQAVLSSPYSTAPDQALAYPLTAYVDSPRYDLGSSPNLPNHNFEVMWGLRNAPNGYDANPADILLDLLTNPRYGAGLQASQVADLTSYRDYCAAAGRRDIILKMDIEGYEWGVFGSMSSARIGQFSQIVLELHTFALAGPDLQSKIVSALEKLYASHQPVHIHANNHGYFGLIGGVPIADTVEVTYVRRADHTFTECRKVFPTEMDMPWRQDMPDFFLGPMGGLLAIEAQEKHH